MSKKIQTLNHRDFLKPSPIAFGSEIIVCGRVEPLAGGVAAPAPTAPPMLAPGTVAETMFVNGKVVTMDAAETI